MNTIWAYHDIRTRQWYDPVLPGAPPAWRFAVGDLVRLRLALTKGRAAVDSDGKPLAAFRVNCSDQITAVVSFKKMSDLILGAAGPLLASFGGFDTGDTGWHTPASGLLTPAGILFSAAAVPSGLDTIGVAPEVELRNAAGVRWTLDTDPRTRCATIDQRVLVGTETGAPSGLPGGTNGDFDIEGTATEAILDIPGFTDGGYISVATLPSTGGAGTPIPIFDRAYTTANPGKARYYVDEAPGTGGGYHFTWVLVNL